MEHVGPLEAGKSKESCSPTGHPMGPHPAVTCVPVRNEAVHGPAYGHWALMFPGSKLKAPRPPMDSRRGSGRGREEIEKRRICDFPGGSMAKNLPCNSGDVGSIPGQGTRTPHVAEQPGPVLQLESLYVATQGPVCPNKT